MSGHGRAGEAPALEVLLDFDGTLVEPNVAIELITEFAPDGRRISEEVDLALHAGEMTLRQAWEREAALLPPDRIEEMIAWVRTRVPLRAGARSWLAQLDRYGVPVTVVSGGLDFYIAPVLAREGLALPVLSDSARIGPDGRLEVTHPHGHASCRLCGICKAQAVLRTVRPGARSVFLGDGSTDRYAAEVTDIVFARRRLIDICRRAGIPYYPFESFAPVEAQFERWLSGAEPMPEPRIRGLPGSKCPISAAGGRLEGAPTAPDGNGAPTHPAPAARGPG